jgi:hypothetical protein
VAVIPSRARRPLYVCPVTVSSSSGVSRLQ